MSTRIRSHHVPPVATAAAASSSPPAVHAPGPMAWPGAARSLRRASLAAGIALALMAALSAFAVFGALGGLGSPGDAARATTALANSEGLFRGGIGALFLVAVLDIIVAAALFEVFAPVSRSLSMLAAWFRVAYAAVFLVAISQLLGMLPGADSASPAAGSVQAFDALWHAGLVLFGIHLMLLGYMAVRSAFMHRIFGILLVVAGIGYLVDSFGSVLSSDYRLGIAQFTFVGEVALIFWLLIRGSRLTALRTTTAAAS